MLRALSIFILLNISSAVFAQPNIVFIFADDLGVGDVGAYGGATINTPHIDALASAAFCSNKLMQRILFAAPPGQVL